MAEGRSSTLVKRANGVQFSRDPLNLRNVYSRKVCMDVGFLRAMD
jgi:large subunit ribosomal protein L28e